MDESTYSQWWPLHIRRAKGVILSPDEQQLYEAGRDQLYQEERLDGGISELVEARRQMLELKEEYNRMRLQFKAMEDV